MARELLHVSRMSRPALVPPPLAFAAAFVNWHRQPTATESSGQPRRLQVYHTRVRQYTFIIERPEPKRGCTTPLQVLLRSSLPQRGVRTRLRPATHVPRRPHAVECSNVIPHHIVISSPQSRTTDGYPRTLALLRSGGTFTYSDGVAGYLAGGTCFTVLPLRG